MVLVTIRYFDDEFDPDTAAATIGIDFKVRGCDSELGDVGCV